MSELAFLNEPQHKVRNGGQEEEMLYLIKLSNLAQKFCRGEARVSQLG
jgi:hypothetical protein